MFDYSLQPLRHILVSGCSSENLRLRSNALCSLWVRCLPTCAERWSVLNQWCLPVPCPALLAGTGTRCCGRVCNGCWPTGVDQWQGRGRGGGGGRLGQGGTQGEDTLGALVLWRPTDGPESSDSLGPPRRGQGGWGHLLPGKHKLGLSSLSFKHSGKQAN